MSANPATVGIISSVGALATLSTDPFGNSVVNLPVIVAPPGVPSGGQAAVGDEAVVRAHTLQGCSITDANQGGIIIAGLTTAGYMTFQATANGVWVESHGRILVAGTGGPPANTATPAKWLQASSANGQQLGYVPLYE